MKTDNNTLRLVFPQWQGGGPIDTYIPELPAEDAFRGYFLGSRLLSFLAPETDGLKAEIPVSLDLVDRTERNGIIAYDSVVKNTRAALNVIREHAPDRIVTLGGECSVSVVPFTWLADKYRDDVAIVWIDAHPDLNYPGEGSRGYHAMALASVLGQGDEQLQSLLPASVDSSRALIVGLRTWEKEGGTPERQRELGVKSYSPSDVSTDSAPVTDWLKNTGARRVLIHFDLDVIDPSDMIAAVGTDPDGMKISEVSRLINDIAREFDVVGLTVAEPMPRVAIRLKNLLSDLPLLRQEQSSEQV
ncbi:arginase family protein [Pantoea septica]|uniref:arginase family protein n=1 Tax=Pantoea septica TaxID=472695 RepID=UPI002897484E|nr:arginase family protein [Pantoea septica]